MVWGRLVVRLGMISSHEDMVTRTLVVTCADSSTQNSSTNNTLTVTIIQLISWPQKGLPHPLSIILLIDKLTRTLMKCSSKQIVVMCR